MLIFFTIVPLHNVFFNCMYFSFFRLTPELCFIMVDAVFNFLVIRYQLLKDTQLNNNNTELKLISSSFKIKPLTHVFVPLSIIPFFTCTPSI